MTVERFKLADGREGSMAPLGDGLTKLLFDDGDMAIIVDDVKEAVPTEEGFSVTTE